MAMTRPDERRPGRSALALGRALVLAGLVLPTACSSPPAQADGAPPPVTSSPLYRDGGPWQGPGAPVTVLAARVLTGRVPQFGGWSGLGVMPGPRGERSRLYAVSDRGYWLRATFDEAGGALDKAVLGRLAGPDGMPLLDNDQRDAEELVLLPDGGAIVSFERDHRLWLYPPTAPDADDIAFDAAPLALPRPPGLDTAPRNGGMEAVALLPDGALAVLIEGDDGASVAQGWIGRPDRPWAQVVARRKAPAIAWRGFTLALPDPAFRPTGAASDGRWLYVMERAFSMPLGFRDRLRRLPLEALDRPETATATVAPLSAETVVSLATPPVADNFEAVTARRIGDETLIHLMTDDNFNGLQRTLLLSLSVP